MKKEKQESPAKAAKKIVTKSIQQRLIKTIKTITTELGQVEVDIEKEAKKLAKKITKHLKAVKEPEKTAALAVTDKKVEKAPAASKTAPVAAAKKPVAKAAPAKAPGAKSSKK
jgi:hypothetical protein